MSHWKFPQRRFPFAPLKHKMPGFPEEYDRHELHGILSGHDEEHERSLQDELDWLTEQLAHTLIGVPLIGQRGQVTIDEGNSSATFTFTPEHEEIDLNYAAFFTPAAFTGAPAAGAFTVKSVVKNTTGFTVEVLAAPGAGTSVIFDWILVREFTR